MRKLAVMGAVSAAILGAAMGAQAATQTYNVSGTLANTLNLCFNIAVSLNTRDCSYAHTHVPLIGDWDGPKAGGGFYPRNSAGDNLNYNPPAAGNDGKLSPPVSGTLTIDDNGTPDGADDTISATWVIGAAAFNVACGNGDKCLERWDSMTQVMAPTAVNVATSLGGGAIEYVIGSRTVTNVGGTGLTQTGKPTPDPLCATANAATCWPNELAPATTSGGPGTPSEFFWDGTYGDLPTNAQNPANNRIGIERSPGFGLFPPNTPAGAPLPSPQPNIGGQTTGTITGYQCVDNTGDTDCLGSESLFGSGLPTYRNENGALFDDVGTATYPDPGNCTNGLDDDADGKIDLVPGNEDPECIPVAIGSAQAVPVPDPPLLQSPPGWDNVILILVTDGQGTITRARAYWTREYILASGPTIMGEPTGVYTINNSYGAGAIDFTGTLPQQVPVAADDSFGDAGAPGVIQDSPTALNVTGNDTFGAPEPNTLSIPAGGEPAHGTAVVTGGTITYTPAQFYSGPDTFDYTLTDGDGDPDTATVTLFVSNKTPTAGNFTASSRNGAATSAIPVLGNPTVLGTGTAADHIVTAGAATGGTCAVSGAGASQAVQFTPEAGFNGPGACDFQIEDADGDTDTGTLNVSVSGNSGGGGGGGVSGPQLPSGGSSLGLLGLGTLLAGLPLARRRRRPAG